MPFLFTCTLAVLCALTASRSLSSDLRSRSSLSTVPSGFVSKGTAAGDTVINLRFAIASNDIPGLHSKLYDVSTPNSPNYGKWLSLPEVTKYLAPDQKSLGLVNSWLAEHNLTAKATSPVSDWLSLDLTVEQANALLSANFAHFVHQQSGARLIRTLSYSSPVALEGHLQFVHPTTLFENPPPRSQGRLQVADDIPLSCNSTITPECLLDIYQIPSTKATQASNNLGVIGFDNEWAEHSDLDIFLADYRPDLVGSSFGFQSVDGGTNNQSTGDGGFEASLDIQYTVGIASGVNVTYISVGGFGIITPWPALVDALLNEDAPPQVITISYGIQESLLTSSDTDIAFMTKLCDSYAALTARGVSIMYSSGDDGVGSFDCVQFSPVFPASCPFVTAVGSTTGINETTADFSGGGFSNVFARPSYQDSHVANYVSQIGSQYSGLYNTTGRGTPDVSTQGYNYSIIVNGRQALNEGTSCSAPVFASIVSLLNDRLIAAGKSPLGFLNPLLYSSLGSAFHDITSGSNPGCGTQGFSALEGWDPATGLGTPQFIELLKTLGLSDE